jgi:hypothetical protein
MFNNDILKVFKHHLGNLKFDRVLYKRVKKFRLQWMNKNEDHIAFLGGNLLGVHKLRFSSLDYDLFFTDVLEVDRISLEVDLHSLESINTAYKVSSDTLYLTIMYLIREFNRTKLLSKKDAYNAAMESYLIFAYRTISSLVSHYFKYQQSEQVILMVYERLSNRYLIKKLGTWQKVFEYRAKDLIEKKGLHYERLNRFITDEIVDVVNDVQGRIRDMVKNIYSLMIEVIESGDHIKILSATSTDIEGEEIVKEITNRQDILIDYMLEIVHDRDSLIKEELVNVVGELLSTLETKLLLQTLDWMVNPTSTSNSKKIDKLIKKTLVISIEYLTNKKISVSDRANIEQMLISLRGLWVSSRGNSTEINKLKSLGEYLVKKAINKKTKWTLTSTRIGLFLYIFLRASAKDAYV